MQLKCVSGSYIFQQPPCFDFEDHLWRLFDFHELTVNHRQKNDPLLNICNALRIGDLRLEHVELLKTREISPSKPNYETMLKDFENALHIFPTNRLVQKHNNKMSRKLKRSVTVFPICAVDTYAGGPQQGQVADQAFVPLESKKCAGIPSILNLGIGSRVMLLRNIDVGGRLCNGSVGTVVGFKWQCLRLNPRQGSCELPASVEVQFEGANSQLLNERGNYDVAPQLFLFQGKKGKNINRRQLPLAEAFAVNVHKVQSLTLDRAVVYLGSKHFVKGTALASP